MLRLNSPNLLVRSLKSWPDYARMLEDSKADKKYRPLGDKRIFWDRWFLSGPHNTRRGVKHIMKNLRLTPQEWQRLTTLRDRSTKPSTLSTPRSTRSPANCRTAWTPIVQKKIERMAFPRQIGKTSVSFWTRSRRSITSSMLSLNIKSVFKTSGVGGYSPKRQKRRARHEQPETRRHAPSRRNGAPPPPC